MLIRSKHNLKYFTKTDFLMLLTYLWGGCYSNLGFIIEEIEALESSVGFFVVVVVVVFYKASKYRVIDSNMPLKLYL